MSPTKPPRGIDCHAHVFSRDAPAIPGARYRPAYAARLEAWREHWDGAGITHGVLVQISFFGTDNSEMLAALSHDPARLRGVAVVDHAVTDSALDRMHELGVRGVRLNLQGDVDFAAYGSPSWRMLFDRIAGRGWHLECHTGAGLVASLAAALSHSRLDVVFDHFAHPGADPEATFDALRRLSDDREVWVKLSGAYRLGRSDARDLARRWIATLGADRLVWGSDWPWTRHERGRDYAQLRIELEDWVGREHAGAVLWDNAARLYGFD